jgi:glycosyltransferase involved in cell wall biosynthesis
VLEDQINTGMNKPRIAICGIRGIPACYGGFETFAQELSTRLVKRTFEVIVYGRKYLFNENLSEFQGVILRYIWAPRHKYLETPIHTLLCLLDIIIFRKIDVVLVCNAANSPFIWLLRLFGIPVAVNVDGIERKRAKWNFLGRLWYRLGEISSVFFANRVIADAMVISSYYAQTYRADSEVIRYGHNETCAELAEYKTKQENVVANEELTNQISLQLKSDIFKQFGLTANNYLLYVSRLEPENNAHVVIEAYRKLSAKARSVPLVIVGDAPYADEYKHRISELAKGLNVIFTGFKFGNDYLALQLGALIYIQATEVGGTHPALVEAMGFANCVVANDTPENVEVLDEAGQFYHRNDSVDLGQNLLKLLVNPELILHARNAALARARSTYSWELVTDQYQDLFNSMAKYT